MDNARAFLIGLANRHKEQMVFDWHTAARLIRERKPSVAAAGLSQDWEWTGGEIYRDGQVVDDYTYLASTWATPELSLDGEIIDCWLLKSETDDWDAKTHWPESALKILRGESD